MRGYRYLALDAQGRLLEGFERVSNRRELALSLSRSERLLVRCSLVRRTFLQGEEFFGTLHHLLLQGLSLRNALELVTETVPSKARWSLCLLLQDIQQGCSFADALRRQDLFPSFVLCSLQQAELSGTLAETCASLQTFFQTQQKLRRQHRQAWVYPGILLVTLWSVLTLLLTTFVPQLKEVLSEESLQMAPSVQRRVLFWLSDLVQKRPWAYGILTGGVGGLCWGILRLRKQTKNKESCVSPESLLWMSAVALLVRSKVPLLQALSMTETETLSSSFRAGVERLIQAIRQGEPFYAALHHLPSLPKSFIRFAQLGEQSGSLGDFLTKGAALATQNYTEAMEKRIAFLTPTVLCLAGGGLLWMVLVLFQPFYQLMSQWE